jgi:hypothetical protein
VVDYIGPNIQSVTSYNDGTGWSAPVPTPSNASAFGYLGTNSIGQTAMEYAFASGTSLDIYAIWLQN